MEEMFEFLDISDIGILYCPCYILFTLIINILGYLGIITSSIAIPCIVIGFIIQCLLSILGIILSFRNR